MRSIEDGVRAFHEKNGYPLDIPLAKHTREESSNQCLELSSAVIELSRATRDNALIDQTQDDERLYRAHLMLEELGETIRALGTLDEEELADGLADLIYVVVGTAESFGIPLGHVVAEVHRSNMTKRKRVKQDPRMRDKGPNYTPPNIKQAIEAGRSLRGWTHRLEEGQ